MAWQGSGGNSVKVVVKVVDGFDVVFGGDVPEGGAVDEGGERKRLAKSDEIRGR